MISDYEFVKESNLIEGITREPTQQELEEHRRFVELSEVSVQDLVKFVSIYQPNARLRDKPHIPGVRVGSHIASPSGPEILKRLEAIVLSANSGSNLFITHQMYEKLHPFTDGNGRSGRVLWAWQMIKARGCLGLNFLHTWYYQSLEAVPISLGCAS